MKRSAVLAGVAILLACSALAGRPTVAQRATVAVEVQVLDAETLRPIPHARIVWVWTPTPRKAKSRTTSDSVMHLEAGPGGVVRLRLPAGVQGAFHVDPGLTECSSVSVNGLETIERKGLLGVDDCDPDAPTRAKLKPIPGRAFLLATPTCCVDWEGPSPEVRILVLNGITGRPMRRLQIDVNYTSANGTRLVMSGRTDDVGVLRVELQRPIGRVIDILPSTPFDYPGCSYGVAMTDLVLAKGIVQHVLPDYCHRRGTWSEPHPQPGQLVTFVRKRTIWEKLFDY